MNANTVLLAILLGMSSWSLVTLLEVKETMAKTVVRVENDDHRIGALEADARVLNAQIVDLRIVRASRTP